MGDDARNGNRTRYKLLALQPSAEHVQVDSYRKIRNERHWNVSHLSSPRQPELRLLANRSTRYAAATSYHSEDLKQYVKHENIIIFFLCFGR